MTKTLVRAQPGSRVPDFFLVGAPKCATSSLYALLTQHPAIFMCRPKEPHFFSTDLPGLAEVSDRKGYNTLFAEAPEGACLGEASAFYLMSSVAAANIHAANPEAKIILSLRNPTDAVLSFYHQMRDGFRENQTSFEAAWVLQETRAEGLNLPSYCPEPRQLQYREIYSYADQVARYLDLFPSDQVLILRFEDIVRSPQEVVDRVLDFLELPDFPVPVALPHKNTRRAVRFPGLAQFISSPPLLLRPLVSPVKRALNALGIKPSVLMMKHLSRPAPKEAGGKAEEDPDFRAHLLKVFREDVERLETFVTLDLAAWRK